MEALLAALPQDGWAMATSVDDLQGPIMLLRPDPNTVGEYLALTADERGAYLAPAGPPSRDHHFKPSPPFFPAVAEPRNVQQVCLRMGEVV